LTSYDFNRNFTISNGTDAAINDTSSPTSAGFVGPVLDLEPSSTVKHVNWIWPSCPVGNGPSSSAATPRGSYNISIHKSFRWNGTEYYTVLTCRSASRTVSRPPPTAWIVRVWRIRSSIRP
jgi:hypothetical protein